MQNQKGEDEMKLWYIKMHQGLYMRIWGFALNDNKEDEMLICNKVSIKQDIYFMT